MGTHLMYLESSDLKLDAKVLKFFPSPTDERSVIVLDKTIFYAQGGGQKSDIGMITGSSGVFRVEDVRFVDGEIHHIGNVTSGNIAEGEEVSLDVDSARRLEGSKLQSGGHLVDMALRNAGYTQLVPLKGYHFPDGPYVEYQGEIEGEGLEAILQSEIDKMISTGYEVATRITDKNEAQKVCYFLPPNLPDNKPIRIVSVWNDQFLPCGGTHVGNISELSGMKITKVKTKKGNTRVSYLFE